MRRLVHHAAIGLGCTALAVSAAVAGLGSPAAGGTAVAVPGTVPTATVPTADPVVVAAERVAREDAANRSAERRRLEAAVDQAVRRSAALSTGSRAVADQQVTLVAEKKAEAAARRQRKAEAKARARDTAVAKAAAKAAAEAAVEAEAARQEVQMAREKAEALAAEQAYLDRVQAQGYEPGTTDPREIARQILQNKFGYGPDQFSCFDNIIIRESNWDIDATNASSGAYGIPQALPGSKMASVGSDWQTNPATQIIWAVGYMDGRYGSPCSAWSFKSANGWY